MAKIVRWSPYQQIADTDVNNMSKYMIEEVLKDIIYYAINGSSDVIKSFSSLVVEQDTGTNYFIKINPFFVLGADGKIYINSAIKTFQVAIPSSSARIDTVQIEFEYSNQNMESRTFIDPVTGNTSASSVYVEFLLDVIVTVKQGIEGSGIAPVKDSGKIKIAEIYVNTTGGIANSFIHNVTSIMGEANAFWTNEQAVTTLLRSLKDHRTNSVLDHPDQSIALIKIAYDAIRNSRCLNFPSVYIQTGNYILLHEFTVPTGKLMKFLCFGISRINGGAVATNMVIEIGSYSGSVFTALNYTNVRNVDLSSSNTFAAGTVVQIRLRNDSGSDQEVTGFAIYVLEGV
jgi:hypothetical protein